MALKRRRNWRREKIGTIELVDLMLMLNALVSRPYRTQTILSFWDLTCVCRFKGYHEKETTKKYQECRQQLTKQTEIGSLLVI